MLDRERIAEPPHREGVSGGVRTVGVEIEFGGLETRGAAGVVARSLGGALHRISDREFTVDAPGLGRFRVELDARWSHPDFVAQHLGDLPDGLDDTLPERVADLVGSIAGVVMPVEIVCPPLPYPDLSRLGPMVEALASAGALGTQHSAFAGFGLHLNVEVASLDADYLLSVLRAYVIRAAWLRRESHIATIRQVQSYVDPFPNGYARFILRPGYRPDIETLIRDHVRFNPSRDYELDMLPVFAQIDRGLVDRLLPGIKNSPRPTFHYRLPNCRIDEPGWDPVDDWNRWVEIERLAADPGRLSQEAEAFLASGPQNELEARLGRIRDAFS